jgi:hypothetical protein
MGPLALVVARCHPHESSTRRSLIAERQEAPLSDINWAVELRKIEREYDGLPPEPTPAELRHRRESERRERDRQEARSASYGVYFRLTLVLSLAICIAAWPYRIECGPSVWAYLGALVVLVIASLWTAVATWQCRAPWRHTIALSVMLWGLILGASQVLPRVGYAMPAPGRPTAWVCTGD